MKDLKTYQNKLPLLGDKIEFDKKEFLFQIQNPPSFSSMYDITRMLSGFYIDNYDN